ncbi:hypothetical protein ACIQWR_37505 [Streptomyces sp. NPDC098789]|uniref:hypothetical protein n=1 Tax=Streptomyces sp. NPDC098789 TaxID=3366098 RepID=UPI00380429CA
MTTLEPKDHEAPGSVPRHPDVLDEAAVGVRPGADAGWGMHSNGWFVQLHNLTGRPVTPWHMRSDMVRSAPELIAPGAVGVVLGQRDPLRPGQPASMSIDLRIDGWPNVLIIRRAPDGSGGDDFTAAVYCCDPWVFTFSDHHPAEQLTVVMTSRIAGPRSPRPPSGPRTGRGTGAAVLLPAARPLLRRQQDPGTGGIAPAA